MSNVSQVTRTAVPNSLGNAAQILTEAKLSVRRNWSTSVVQFAVAAALEELGAVARMIGHVGEAERIEREARALTTEPTHMSPNRGEADEDAAAELLLYITNTGELYGPRSIGDSIEKNYARKWKAGTFNRDKAIVGYKYLVEAAAKRYVKEHGSRGQMWHSMFDVPTRQLVAQMLTDSFVEEAELGNFR